MTPSDNKSCTVNFPFEHCNPPLMNSEDYHPSGLPKLSSVYLTISLIYLSDLGLWISLCLKTKPAYRRVHFLMGGLILMKILSLIIFAAEKKVTGSIISSDLFFYINQSVSLFRLLIVVLLIVNGLPLVKPCLQVIDKIVLAIMIPTQVFDNLDSILTGGISDEMLSLADFITPYAVILMSALSIMKFVGFAARIESGLQQVRYFCVTVFMYLMLTKAFTLARTDYDSEINTTDVYKLELEIIDLLFYPVIFYLFKQYFERIDRQPI